MDTEVRALATQKLIEIIHASSAGSNLQKQAILALGRAGGKDAIDVLIKIYNSASAGSGKQIAAVTALGEAGRIS